MKNPWDILYFYAYDVKLRAIDSIELPAYSGSTLRGALGYALRKVACVPQCKEIEKCILGNRCPYYYAFESQRRGTPEGLKNYPHPFILEPMTAQTIQPGSEFSFGLILIGQAVKILPYFIYAFIQMGELGIGKNRGKFSLIGVKSRPSGKLIFDSKQETIQGEGEKLLPKKLELGSRIQVAFQTPTRLKVKGTYQAVPKFESIIRAGLRRMSLLAKGYCGSKLELSFPELVESSRKVKIARDRTNWEIINRYSSRQRSKIPMYGFTGAVEYVGDFTPFGELVDAMQWLHIGGATAFGFGKIVIKTIS